MPHPSQHITNNTGRTRVPLLVVISLLFLKHAFNESDKGGAPRWVHKPRWQCFSGCVCYEGRQPCDASTTVKFHQPLFVSAKEAGIAVKQTFAKNGQAAEPPSTRLSGTPKPATGSRRAMVCATGLSPGDACRRHCKRSEAWRATCGTVHTGCISMRTGPVAGNTALTWMLRRSCVVARNSTHVSPPTMRLVGG